MMQLDDDQKALLAGEKGSAAQTAARIVTGAGRLLGAQRLIPIASAHIDGCLYHGDSGVEFAEFLVRNDGKVKVRSTLNIGSIDLLNPKNALLKGGKRRMAQRLMKAYVSLGCQPTWTCSPYQAGHRPNKGEQVAWGESNAVAFCNSVLGAHTNRYGDFLDIACALIGYAPEYGLHLEKNRAAKILFTTDFLSPRLKNEDAFWPVLGALYGSRVGDTVAVIDGLADQATEDRLKALGAAAASFGSVALFHVAGATPEASTPEAAAQGQEFDEIIPITQNDVIQALDMLTTTGASDVTAIGVGSPHLSLTELTDLLTAFNGRKTKLPFYANTGRHVVDKLAQLNLLEPIKQTGIEIIADTCIVATPIIKNSTGVLMTNSAKFSHYAPGNIRHEVIYGSLSDCVETAVSGKLTRDLTLWR